VAHYLHALWRGDFRLVPAAGVLAVTGRRTPLRLERARLAGVPDSPDLQAALSRLPPECTAIRGSLSLAEARRPQLCIEELGGWTLRLPVWAHGFVTLRELRTPQDLRPTRSRDRTDTRGRPARRHWIPLRYHGGAYLVIEITRTDRGEARYRAWIWHAARRRPIALLWEEAARVISLFRDFAASWLWVTPTRPGSGVDRPARAYAATTEPVQPPLPTAPGLAAEPPPVEGAPLNVTP
jgi:hypothetical protein